LGINRKSAYKMGLTLKELPAGHFAALYSLSERRFFPLDLSPNETKAGNTGQS
jgi:hypothetical protein